MVKLNAQGIRHITTYTMTILPIGRTAGVQNVSLHGPLHLKIDVPINDDKS